MPPTHPSLGEGEISLWLDVDTGHDDAFAILLAARHPHIHLLGISTTYGNAPLRQTTHNTLAILTAIRRTDVPVYAGAAKPFCRETWHAPEIHGDSGLDGTTCLPEPTSKARNANGETEAGRSAVEAMAAALKGTPDGTAWLVATGALTNVALLFATHPELAGHLAGLSIMGGAVGGGFTDAPMGVVAGEGERFGNYTPFAEFNVYIDPESASSIFSNKPLAAKTTLIPLDLTHQFLATVSIQQFLRLGPDIPSPGLHPSLPPTLTDDERSETRKLFLEILTFFAETYANVFGITAGPPLHDPLAVAVAEMPGNFDDRGGERFAVDVVREGAHGPEPGALDGSQCGRTVVRKLAEGEQGVRIPRGLVDEERVWRVIGDCLESVERDDDRSDGE